MFPVFLKGFRAAVIRGREPHKNRFYAFPELLLGKSAVDHVPGRRLFFFVAMPLQACRGVRYDVKRSASRPTVVE